MTQQSDLHPSPNMEDQYDYRAIEAKWQVRWERDQVYRAVEDPSRPKFYGLDMFPYPSGAGLSVGHCRNYVPMDAACRFRSMRGYNVLHPMGWDAFGQPAENEALKRGSNPREMVPRYAANYRRQLSLVGIGYDWSREINSTDPSFYRWTQWFFLQMYHRKLAYRSVYPGNWCPSCRTILAREDVQEGRCWRCHSLIEKKMMPQWFLRIREYADRLLADLDTIDWPESTKRMQREWIGRSEGAEVRFPVIASSAAGAGGEAPVISVFTTRPDTLFGATFMVLAPEHALVAEITAPEHRAEVEAYVRQAQRATEIERMSTERTKTGVFTGAYARNPVNDEAIPIWIADYVLMGYGTGAIMAVPAHDQRDFEFARKYDIPIRLVYQVEGGPRTPDEMTQAVPDGGVVINSGRFDGLPNNKETVRAFTRWLQEQGKGEERIDYRLRDWAISRQRYWGTPIPIVYCEACGEVPVPEDQLPVLLPDVESYAPTGTGESPLAAIPDFVNTTCPRCGGPAKRETDTMAGSACSSWYHLRFTDPHNEQAFASPGALRYWMPVDLYAGGAEHAVGHLLYARFWTKVLYDAGLLTFTEPYLKLRHQGSVLIQTPGRKPQGDEAAGENDSGEHGAGEGIVDWIVLRGADRETVPKDQWIWRWARMSKSAENVITPDEMAETYGVDSLRLYEMFVAPFEENVQWTNSGIEGASRFLHRLWRLYRDSFGRFVPGWREELAGDDFRAAFSGAGRQVRRKLHQTIRKVTADVEAFSFNTAVAALMELVNDLYGYVQGAGKAGAGRESDVVLSEALENLVLLLAPLAPHLADELWERLGREGYTYHARWPAVDDAAAVEDEITFAIQVNGKLRDRLVVPSATPDDEARDLALRAEKVLPFVEGKTIHRVVVVPRKLINIVVG